jgi:superfamily II DNA/RNA helicase
MFTDYPLSAAVVSSLAARGITIPTPIQAESLPFSLEGRDILGRARTGTGKTLAFALPIVTKLAPSRVKGRLPRALVLAPTRELAKQTAKEFEQLGVLEVQEFYGGTSYAMQERAIRYGVDVIVGTPGRIQDHLDRNNLNLSELEFVVLDEADEMLSMGFQDQVEKILETAPAARQTMLFSATMPRWVERLAAKHQKNAAKIDLVENATSVQSNVQHHSIKIQPAHRTRVLADMLTVLAPERAIIFTKTKRDCDELALELIHRGFEAEAIHGDLAQSQRERVLDGFRAGRSRVLVATDVAARGIDIPDIELVVQHHFPHDTESYVHRSGRTGRAGRSGKAIVLFTQREERDLRNLERVVGNKFIPLEAPSPNEVRTAAARHAANELNRIPVEVLSPFQYEADRLLEEMGSEALARALAVIAGVTHAPKKVSLLTEEEGLTTLELRGQRLSIPRAVAMIAKGANISSKILGKMQMFGDGIYVDVPNDLATKLLALSPLEDVTIEVATELRSEPQQRTERRYDDRGGRSGSFNNRHSNNSGGYSPDRGYQDRNNTRPQGGGFSNSGQQRSGGYKYRDDRGNPVAPQGNAQTRAQAVQSGVRDERPSGSNTSRREFSPAPREGGFARGKRFERR